MQFNTRKYISHIGNLVKKYEFPIISISSLIISAAFLYFIRAPDEIAIASPPHRVATTQPSNYLTSPADIPVHMRQSKSSPLEK